MSATPINGWRTGGANERIVGFWIPKMVGWDDAWMVVEVDLMQQAPYIIDFAGRTLSLTA